MILAERARQAEKWGGEHDWGSGDCSSSLVNAPVKAAVLAEECGEAAQAMLDRDTGRLTAELTQVAAVAVAWLEELMLAERQDGRVTSGP